MSVASTLHGYQVQYLYTLYRMLMSPDSKEVFLPEGREDLDIYLDGQIVETVQVKCYSAAILYSDLFSKAKTTSLFSRGKASLEENPNVKISFVAVGNGNSKGVISDRLLKVSSLTKFLNKEELLHLDYSSSKELASKIIWQTLSEAELNDAVEAVLKERFPSIDSIIVKDLLVQWIHYVVMNRKSVTYNDLFQQVDKIIQFNVQQKEFFTQFGLTVIPLFQTDYQDNANYEMAYYQGVSAKEIHIVKNYDVVREEKLQLLHEKLKDNKLVFISGVSGSGKSSLAYRYLKICDTPLRYEIKYINQNNISQIIATIKDVSKGLKSDAFVYIDVMPSDNSWVSIVNEIENVPYIRCVVTIRQDDWNRCCNKIRTDLHYSTLFLDLTEHEAKDIFCNLRERGLCKIDVFEDTWNDCGQPRSLLEYVYFLTQGVSLRTRIAEQVDALTDSNVKLLQYIAVSNFLHGEISVDAIGRLCGLVPVVLSQSIGQMNGELFVCDGVRFSDVHPIRTRIIIEVLFGHYRNGLFAIGMQLFDDINENTSPLFLIALLDEGKYTPENILTALDGKRINAMQAYIVAKTLVWCGVKRYVENNKAAFDWLRWKAPQHWQYLLPVNFTEMGLDESVDGLWARPIGTSVAEIKNIFSPQIEVYDYLAQWLNGAILLDKPTDWYGYIWLARFLTICNIQLSYKPVFYNFELETKDADDLDEMADVLLGLKLAGYDHAMYNKLEEKFVEQFRLQNKILVFEYSDDGVKCLTFLDYLTSGERFRTAKGDLMHCVNMHNVDLLRKAFPNAEKYHSEIIKDEIFEDVSLPFEKDISRVNLPLGEMIEPRSTMVYLYKQSYVLPNRKAYCDKLILLRKLYVSAIERYWQAIDDVHKENKVHNAKMDRVSQEVCDDTSTAFIELPASEINRFGIAYGKHEDANTNVHSSKDALEELNAIFLHYSTCLNVFFRQSYIPSYGFINEIQRMEMLLSETQETMRKMQCLFHQVFDCYVDGIEAKCHDRRENRQLQCLAIVYHWLIQKQPYKSCRQLLKLAKPKMLPAGDAEMVIENSNNRSTSVVDAKAELTLLRDMQKKSINSRSYSFDEVSTRIVETYFKSYDNAIRCLG